VFTEKGKEELEKYGWTVMPEGVWFGVDYDESHKTNVLDILTDLLNLDADVQGYNFLVCAYQKEKY
jgi:uncharacterized protein with NRDE domain